MDYQTDPKISELLIKYGADVNVLTPKNEHGQTNGWSPIFYAIYCKRADLVNVLLKHHAKVTFRVFEVTVGLGKRSEGPHDD